MNWAALGARFAEAGYLPDQLIRFEVLRRSSIRIREFDQLGFDQQQETVERFIAMMRSSPVAVVPEKANEQHYEIPASFFELVLGPHRKYSCCLWDEGATTLEAAEARALQVTCERAEISDGARILELGCGWGSLTLWMAKHYPNSHITAVSNSSSQRLEVEKLARERGLSNVEVITADMNVFSPVGTFDRVVSVEMFEHMRNYEELLRRISTWLNPNGKLFVHIFTHDRYPYPFECQGDDDWMSRHFFTGGMMPSDGLLHRFQRDLELTRRWRWSGMDYYKTCQAWLKLLDTRRDQALPILSQVYGLDNARVWLQRWRMFFIACAELFGYGSGKQWGISHYLFERW